MKLVIFITLESQLLMPLSGQQARICFAQKLLDLNKSTKRLLEA